MENNIEIKLEKGEIITLEGPDSSPITEFCVGVNWGITYKTFAKVLLKTEEVDLDLNCILIDNNNNICDYLNCAAYKMPKGKFVTDDGALRHSGDDVAGDMDGDDKCDNETITVNLTKIDQKISQIFFFLNNLEKKDFSKIQHVEIRIYEGTPEKVEDIFACYNVSAKEYIDKKAIIMGKLHKNSGKWEFQAIGDTTDDDNLLETIKRIKETYL
ncbi:MAG: TerD family protein [Marinilabiliaceae bacterium]|nr:TerD family protein [Marinilabiliaceae bacterium]